MYSSFRQANDQTINHERQVPTSLRNGRRGHHVAQRAWNVHGARAAEFEMELRLGDRRPHLQREYLSRHRMYVCM